jgi:hypothetical protein
VSWEIEFITDCRNLTFEELEKKYSKKIPKNTSVRKIITAAKANNELDTFVDTTWYGDKRDQKVHFLCKSDHGKFEVFVSERGAKHWLTKYDNLEDAVASKLSLILNDLEFVPSNHEK